MEKDKHIPSLEHSRSIIFERAQLLMLVIDMIKRGHTFNKPLSLYQQELAGHEQGLKALDNHYALLKALKEAQIQIEYLHERGKETGTGVALISHIDSLIKQCEG